MWLSCILSVLLLLICAGIADAVPARITAEWSYEIEQANGDVVKNAGSVQGFGDLTGQQENPFVSFSAGASGVQLTAAFNPMESEPCSLHVFSFSFADGTAAISGSGHGCARGNPELEAGFAGRALDLGDGQLDVSLSGATSDIVSVVFDIFGTAVVVSEPADFAFLSLGVGLLPLYWIRRKQLG